MAHSAASSRSDFADGALTAHGKERVFEQFNLRNTFEHRARYLRNRFALGKNVQALTPAQVENTCGDAEELQRAMQDLQQDISQQLQNGNDSFSARPNTRSIWVAARTARPPAR